MLCPHCHEPIDPALVRAAANKDAATRERPRAKGQAKRGCKHWGIWSESKMEYQCRLCQSPVFWNAKTDRWRIRYPKQKSPAE